MGWRSHWLAKRLTSLGVQVNLYELTEHAGWSHPEDIDGPFPFSITSKSPSDFVNSVGEKESLVKLDSGFCMSTEDGNLAWEAQNRDYVLENLKKSFYQVADEKQKFWFEDFLKSFGKSFFKKSSDWKSSEPTFDLETDLFLRRSDKSAYKDSLYSLKECGVQVHEVDAKNLDDLLSKVKECPQEWIVSLTIFELKLLTYNKVESLDTALGWHRKRFFYSGEGAYPNLESLPAWSCWLKSPFRPWKDENLNILIKGQEGQNNSDSFIDVWTLEPIYKLDIKEQATQKALSFLEEKFSYVDFSPQLNESLGGALKSLFPVAQEQEPLNDSGYIWNSPIEWEGYSMDLMYKFQNSLAHQIYDKGVDG